MNKEIKRTKMLCMDLILLIGLLLCDQITKYFAIIKLKGQEAFVLIDGVLELDYLENRGTAFGMFQNQKLFILLIGCICMAVVLFFMLRIPQQKKFIFLHVLMTFIIAGGIGNMIDRIRFDYVVDFISFILIHYPVFNVADCYIVCATIMLFVLFLFVYKDSDLDFLSLKKKQDKETM